LAEAFLQRFDCLGLLFTLLAELLVDLLRVLLALLQELLLFLLELRETALELHVFLLELSHLLAQWLERLQHLIAYLFELFESIRFQVFTIDYFGYVAFLVNFLSFDVDGELLLGDHFDRILKVHDSPEQGNVDILEQAVRGVHLLGQEADALNIILNHFIEGRVGCSRPNLESHVLGLSFLVQVVQLL